MKKLVTKLVFMVHRWSQTGQLDVFLPKPVKVKVLTNQQLTHGAIIFANKPIYIFSGMCDLDASLRAGPTCQ
jgi:hypothetical protein